VYPSSSDARPSNLHWGVYRGDLATNEIGVNLGTTDYSTTGSNNAILYIKVPDVHRWNGVNYEVTVPNGLPGGGTKYSVNPGKYQMYYPTPGNIKFENAGTVKFIGSGNAGAWISSYIPDRTKYITGATKPQILNLGKLQLIGDKNVGYYFANNENFASGNGVFQGKVIVDAELGTTLDGSTGQNAFEQARQFAAVTQITSLAITKLDGTAKGGVVIGISDQLKVPVKYIGLGEGMEDLQLFDKVQFVDSLFK